MQLRARCALEIGGASGCSGGSAPASSPAIATPPPPLAEEELPKGQLEGAVPGAVDQDVPAAAAGQEPEGVEGEAAPVVTAVRHFGHHQCRDRRHGGGEEQREDQDGFGRPQVREGGAPMRDGRGTQGAHGGRGGGSGGGGDGGAAKPPVALAEVLHGVEGEQVEGDSGCQHAGVEDGEEQQDATA